MSTKYGLRCLNCSKSHVADISEQEARDLKNSRRHLIIMWNSFQKACDEPGTVDLPFHLASDSGYFDIYPLLSWLSGHPGHDVQVVDEYGKVHWYE